jgi:hypothetical protein
MQPLEGRGLQTLLSAFYLEIMSQQKAKLFGLELQNTLSTSP